VPARAESGAEAGQRSVRSASPARFHPLLFLFLLGAIWLVNYPGRVNPDSLEQLIGAAFPAYRTDWHSPIVAWLWNVPAPLLGQPAAALLVQSLLIAFGGAIVSRGGPRNGWKGALVGMAGVILKDVFLLGTLLAAWGSLRLWLGSRSRIWLAATAAFLFVAAVVRPPNVVMFAAAAALVLPFLCQGWGQYLRRFGLACACLLAAASIGAAIDRHLLRAIPAHPEVQVIIFDIAGTSVGSGANLFTRMPGWSAPALPDLHRCYQPALWDSFAPWGDCRAYVVATRAAVARSGGAAFARWWLGELLAHPLAYAGHRLAYMRIAITDGTTEPSYLSTGPAALNGKDSREILRAAAAGRMPLSMLQVWDEERMPAFVSRLTLLMFWLPWLPALAFLACLAFLGSALNDRRRGRPPTPALLAAAMGVGNVAMMAVFGAASSPRYFLPLLLGAYLAATAELQRRGARSEPSPHCCPGFDPRCTPGTPPLGHRRG
jgi:hypothetical protein